MELKQKTFSDLFDLEKHIFDYHKHFRKIFPNISKEFIIYYRTRIKDMIPELFSDPDIGINKDSNITKIITVNEYRMLTRILLVPYFGALGDVIGFYNKKYDSDSNNIFMGSDYICKIISEYLIGGGLTETKYSKLCASCNMIFYLEVFHSIIYCTSNNIKLDMFSSILKKMIVESLKKNDVQFFFKDNKSIIDPYNSASNKNYAVIGAGSIGLAFISDKEIDSMIFLSIECARVLHNSASSILGCVASSYFTMLAIKRVKIEQWGFKLMKIIDESGIIEDYLQKQNPDDYAKYVKDKYVFIGKFKKYLDLMFTTDEKFIQTKVMDNPVSRYEYLVDNFSKACNVPASCADDCIIYAYDSMLRCNGKIERAILYSALHSGNASAIGILTLSWYGAYYGVKDMDYNRPHLVPFHQFRQLVLFQNITTLMVDSSKNIIRNIIFYRHELYEEYKKLLKE